MAPTAKSERFNLYSDFSQINDTHRRILAASELLLGKIGVGGFEMKTIANQLELTPSLIHHYYKTGEELMFHAVIFSYKKYVTGIQEATHDETDPEKVLNAWVTTTLRWTQELPGIGVILEFPLQVIRSGSKLAADSDAILNEFLHIVAELGQSNVAYMCSAIRGIQKKREFKSYSPIRIAAFIKSDARFAMYSSTVGFTTLGGGLWIAGRNANNAKTPYWMNVGFNPEKQIEATFEQMLKVIKQNHPK